MKITIEDYKRLLVGARATINTIAESAGINIDDCIEVQITPLTISFTMLLHRDGRAYIEGDDVATAVVCEPLSHSDWILLKEALV